MDVATLYRVISANIAGVVLFVIIMAYLSYKGIIVGGQRFAEMQADRDYWRSLVMNTMQAIEPRIDRLAATPPNPPAQPAAPASDQEAS